MQQQQKWFSQNAASVTAWEDNIWAADMLWYSFLVFNALFNIKTNITNEILRVRYSMNIMTVWHHCREISWFIYKVM